MLGEDWKEGKGGATGRMGERRLNKQTFEAFKKEPKEKKNRIRNIADDYLVKEGETF